MKRCVLVLAVMLVTVGLMAANSKTTSKIEMSNDPITALERTRNLMPLLHNRMVDDIDTIFAHIAGANADSLYHAAIKALRGYVTTLNVLDSLFVADDATIAGILTVSDSTRIADKLTVGHTRGASEYEFVVDVTNRAGGIFPNGGPYKTYVYNTEVDREATEDMTGDSRDVMYKGVYRNYGQNDESSNVQGIGISVRNESGGTFANIKAAEFGANTKSGATTTNVTGIETTVEHYSAGATTNLYGAKIDIRNEGTEATNQYGVIITNTDNSTAGASDAAVYITDAGTNTGWDYGIDMSSATIGTAEIIGQNDETIDNATDGTWNFGTAKITAGLVSAHMQYDSVVTNTDGTETVTAAQSGCLIVATKSDGATTVTLPDPSAATVGVEYKIMQTANQNLVVVPTTADGNSIIADNVATSDQVSCATASHLIGSGIVIVGISATQWFAYPMSPVCPLTVEAAD